MAAAAAPPADLLHPNAILIEPPQCSIFFEPSEWSRRYANTFFTVDFDGNQQQPASQSSPADPATSANGQAAVEPLFHLIVRSADQAWPVARTYAQFEQLASQLRGELAAHQHSFAVPPLPAAQQTWSLLGGSKSVGGVELRTWLHGVLGGAKKMCLFPSVRAFLQLDRPWPKEESSDEDEEGEGGRTAANADMTDQ